MENLHVRWIRPAIALFGICIASGNLVAVAAEDQPGKAGEIVSIKGSGEHKDNDAAQWRGARVSQDLFNGNYIRTGNYSRMGILFRDRTQIRVNQKTVLMIKSVQGTATGTNTVINLNRGRVWTQTKTLPRGLLMNTPSATAAIRGTDWDIEVDDRGAATITVLSGEVDFYNDHGRVLVGRNEQARAEVGKAPVKLVIVQPRDRVQWVTAYSIDPLQHIYFYSAAIKPLKQSLAEIRGDSVDAHVDRGNIYADMGQWKQAEEEYNKALGMDRLHAAAAVGLGYAALARKNWRQAGALFGRVSAGGNVGELAEIGRVAVDAGQDDLGSAITRLSRLIGNRGLRQPAAYLVLSDIMVYSGELSRALNYAEQAQRRFPDNARCYAQLARLYMLADRSEDSHKAIKAAQQKDSRSYEARIAGGELARVEGDADEALSAYRLATRESPEKSAAWFGLGVVNTEREYVSDARVQLEKALSLSPAGPGYQSELGVLESFANNFDDAEAAFESALKQNPSDYRALTGLGILQLKRGRTAEALDMFLRAGLMEPRYARARMYTGVAYYQSGYVNQALEELRVAAELDANDPMPHLLASIIYSDLLRPGEAISEARKASALMPNLKSLNQLANTQRGTTNLGQAFAFMGMEDWAQMYAQESYYPFWAGSHLFLADRYAGLFTKNSELFQGFIADPTVFGASNLFQTLVEKPGQNINVSYRGTSSNDGDEDFSGTSPFIELSGFSNGIMPLAYYGAFENFDLDFDSGPYERDSYTLALGFKPSHFLGMFLFADRGDLLTGVEGTDLASGVSYQFDEALISDRADLGAHIKFSPRSQLWFKAGNFQSGDIVEGMIAGESVEMDVTVDVPEFAVRQTIGLGNHYEISLGYEQANRETDVLYRQLDTANTVLLGTPVYGVFDQAYSEDSSDAYVSARIKFTTNWLVQLDAWYQQHERTAHEDFYLEAPAFGLTTTPVSTDFDYKYDQVSPRFGMSYRFADHGVIRVAYQNWVRPASFSSLGSVATAGIALDDRLVARGGELTRSRGQVEWELTPRLFASAFADYKEINNNRFTITTPYAINDLEGLDKLKSRDPGSLTRDDLLEFISTPDYESGTISSGGFSLNYLLAERWGVYGKYVNTVSANTGDTYTDNWLPYLPAYASALGLSWTHPGGFYLVGRMIHRSERYADEANTRLLDAGWNGAADIYWQSPAKHWLIRFSVDDAMDDTRGTQYTAEASMRF
ncbi:MAG: tetratricopeptide repeat protein [Gammaproteobacteria bacterium]|nr:tetratricopeptide repeat protein [Gammaproteobacteria bacterium]